VEILKKSTRPIAAAVKGETSDFLSSRRQTCGLQRMFHVKHPRKLSLRELGLACEAVRARLRALRLGTLGPRLRGRPERNGESP